MGGISLRKKASDEATIRLKKTKGGGSAGGGSDNYEKMTKCPQAFKVALPLEPKLSKGLSLTLRMNKDKLTIFYANMPIIDLDAKLQIKIAECIEWGFRYDGIIETDEKGNYARFHRITA